jgi:hypothetical protein
MGRNEWERAKTNRKRYKKFGRAISMVIGKINRKRRMSKSY